MPDLSSMPTTSDSASTPRFRFPRGRRTLIAPLLVLGLAAVVAEGARRKPADPVEPVVLERTERVDRLEHAATLRVATFNMHAGVGRDGIRDLGRTADALPDLDVVALQEVRNPLFSPGGPQVSEVADRLAMAWLFVPAERRWWHNDYGNALLTRATLADCVRIPLPTGSRRRFRSAFLANVRHRDQIVHLLAVHIDKDLNANTHDEQLRTTFDLFLSLQAPAILLGDLNEFGSHPQLIRLLKTPGVRNALANIPGPTVKKNPIDWIVTRGFQTVNAEWITTPASDHPVARAELQLLKETSNRDDETASLER